VVKSGECKFLGFTFPSGRISWHPQTLEKFKQRVRELTNRNWGVLRQYQLDKLSEYLRGGLIILALPAAISAAWNWINGFDAECEWRIGDSGAKCAPEYEIYARWESKPAPPSCAASAAKGLGAMPRPR
jgi:hypothetical protein